MQSESNRSCARCGAAFYAKPSRVRNGRGKFCGKPCMVAFKWALATATVRERFLSKVSVTTEHDLWTGPFDQDGYGMFMFHDGARWRSRRAPRVAWTLFVGPIPAGLWVLHHCDTPACVRIAHLFLGTAKQNTEDMWTKGRAKPTRPVHTSDGTKSHFAKLDDASVRIILVDHAAGVSQCELARRFHVHHQTIWNIVHKKNWKHLTR